jgi:hypothetical protein
MGAIGLNPIRLDAIGLDPIRFNAIRLGVPGASSATDRPYISPDVLSALAGVWIADGKSNTDSDRNIIKNKLPDRGGDFEIFNAAYEGMSGCNGYPVVFGANKTWEHLSGTANYTSDTTSTTIHITHVGLANKGLLYSYVKENGVLTNIKEIPAFRVTVKGLEGNSKLVYKYLATKDATKETSLHLSNGTHKLPKSFVPTDALLDLTTNSWIGMYISPISEEVTEFDCDITIEVLPEYEGSFVTDGVNDMIVSQNPVSKMLGGSKELTVVSMIHQISPVPDSYGFTNYIREGSIWSRTNVKTSGKTGIYGYKISKGNTEVGASNLINNILGDKADYEAMGYNITNYSDINYSVAGYIKDGRPTEVSSVAWYWTFIAKRALTTDEINQVIAYYNLDKYVKPDILCDVKRQGITNENHAEFGDQLIDFVGGHNIQLNNIGWEGESGIIDGALYLDGISDFGKATGLPILKDYTICALRKWLYGDSVTSTETGSIVSKSKVGNDGAFILEQTFNRNPSRSSTFSFGTINSLMSNDKLNEESFTYQTKYSYNGEAIVSGSGVDSDSMWLGTIRDGDSRFSKFALWSLMRFPYSLSEFLLERQLRKYKAGTLYPDMVEFRPIVKSNIPYSSISYSVNPGVYVAEGSMITITITLSNETDKLVGVSSNAIADISISGDNGTYEITGKVTKSPQKISIVISSYLTMLGNDTLISNETLIKNE